MRLLAAACLVAALAGLASTVSAQDAQPQLWDASIAGDTVAIRQALRNGAKVDSLDTRRAANGRRALNWAALYNHVPAIHVLLAAGASVDSSNRTGFAPLHHAAEAGALEAAQALLKAGANPRLVTLSGGTPAAVARARGFAAVAQLLEAAERGDRP
jgi:ankyrin repeat protein